MAKKTPKPRPANLPEGFETRVISGVKFRMEKRDGKNIAVGHAAVFNSESLDLGGFTEVVAPGAFSDVLKSDPDTRALFNHDPSMVLGRSIAKTLRMVEDGSGLKVEIDMPDVTYANDLQVLMDRGDIDQMSFAFRVAQGGDEWKRTESGPRRTVKKIAELSDVSIVTYPAYPDSRVAMRSLMKHPEVLSSVETVELDDDFTPEQIKAIQFELDDAKKNNRAAVLPKGAHLRCGGMGYDPYGGSGEMTPVHRRCMRAIEHCRDCNDSMRSLHDAMDQMPATGATAAEHRHMKELREHIAPLVRSCRGMCARMDFEHPAIRPEGFRDDEMYAMYGGGQEGDEGGGGTWTANEGENGWLTSGTSGSATDDGNGGMPKNDQGQNAVMRSMEMAQKLAEDGDYENFELLAPIGDEFREAANVAVNEVGISEAHGLIGEGKINHGKWDADRVSMDKAHAKCFAAVDNSIDESKKGHWMFPIIHDGEVYSGGVANALGRAKGSNYAELAKKLQSLDDAIKAKGNKEAA